MLALITGGSGSGKSAYAEDYAVSLSKGMKIYYLATMRAFGREAGQRIARHRTLRSGKGFLTIEQPAAIYKALERMETGEKTVLLECISNLAANEMFEGEMPKGEEAVFKEVANGIARLREEVTHLVVVSNNVFEDGITYDRETMAYIRAMGRINEKLSAMADEVVEVVVGIPLMVKDKKSESRKKRK